MYLGWTLGLSRRGLTEDLQRHVLEEIGLQDFTVVFQPIVDLRTYKLFAYEALLRSSDMRFTGPPHVFQQAITAEVCGELGRVVREVAVETCREFSLFLNVHPAEFDDGWMVRPDDPIFKHEHAVYLEITESVPMSHEDHCRGTLDEIRGKGIFIAIDDLGAGYSNLKYIADLKPEIVKLDRSLITRMDEDERLFRLTHGVIRLARDLDAQVVAEGIETEGELAAVRQAGADYGQGYRIARPAFPPPLVL